MFPSDNSTPAEWGTRKSSSFLSEAARTSAAWAAGWLVCGSQWLHFRSIKFRDEELIQACFNSDKIVGFTE